MSVGVWRAVLLANFHHDCEGNFLTCYEVLTLSERQESIMERFISRFDGLKLPFGK